MKPVKDEYGHDDAMRHLRMLLRLCEDSVCQYCTEGSDRGDGSCMGTRSDWRNALEAYIENTEIERDNYFAAMNAGLVRARELIEERAWLAASCAKLSKQIDLDAGDAVSWLLLAEKMHDSIVARAVRT